MPTYSNRILKEAYVESAVLGDSSIWLTTSIGAYVVPETVLTSKIFPEEDFAYKFEFDALTYVLTGVFSPDGRSLYRLDDRLSSIAASSPDHLSTLQKNGERLNPGETIEYMMKNISPFLIERLKTLPQEYLNEYYMYEVKVSYLASTSDEIFIFDPTPSEMAHAFALSNAKSTKYPPLVPKTY